MPPTMELTTTWERTCEVGELEPGWGEVALVARSQIALVRLADEEVYAVDHHDPCGGVRHDPCHPEGSAQPSRPERHARHSPRQSRSCRT